MIVNVGENESTILDLQGRYKILDTRKVDLIARYDVLENPISQVSFPNANNYLYEVSAQNNTQNFYGFAVAFFEDLVIFFDLQGKSHVIEANKISYLRAVKLYEGKSSSLNHGSSVTLLPPELKRNCNVNVKRQDATPRVLDHVSSFAVSGTFKIATFFSDRRKGYRELEGLEERTLFYARPTYFDDRTRLGLAYTVDSYENTFGIPSSNWEQNMPAYLSFGSGKPYRFQSSFKAGNITPLSTPSLKSIGGIETQFKSHLIHGVFAANFDAFTAGKAVRQLSDFSKARPAVWSLASFNHLTLLGFDYGSWSLSYGYFFPVFMFGHGFESREVMSNTTSPVVRSGWKNNNFDINLFLYMTNLHGQPDLSRANAGLSEQNSTSDTFLYASARGDIQSYSLKSYASRLQLKYQTSEKTFFETSALFKTTDYSEDMILLNSPRKSTTNNQSPLYSGSTERHTLYTKSLGLSLGVHFDFGQWVGMRGNAIVDHIQTSGVLDSTSESSSSSRDTILSYEAGLEFLL